MSLDPRHDHSMPRLPFGRLKHGATSLYNRRSNRAKIKGPPSVVELDLKDSTRH